MLSNVGAAGAAAPAGAAAAGGDAAAEEKAEEKKEEAKEESDDDMGFGMLYHWNQEWNTFFSYRPSFMLLTKCLFLFVFSNTRSLRLNIHSNTFCNKKKAETGPCLSLHFFHLPVLLPSFISVKDRLDGLTI